jgi:hypothetical protein
VSKALSGFFVSSTIAHIPAETPQTSHGSLTFVKKDTDFHYIWGDMVERDCLGVDCLWSYRITLSRIVGAFGI